MHLLFIIGTRPEAIKLAPVILEAKKDSFFKVTVCKTGQHKELTDSILKFFEIDVDYDLNVMEENQRLSTLTSHLILGLDKILEEISPDIVIVQGDTTSAFVGALSSFYHQIPVAHVEAGLRTRDKYSPFPEEINRKLTASLTDFHFAPTELAKTNLDKEGLDLNIVVTGNTVIDSVLNTCEIIESKGINYLDKYPFLKEDSNMVLVTCHRRENLGDGMNAIFKALENLAKEFSETNFIFPLHPNPKISKQIRDFFIKTPNFYLTEAVDYPEFIWLMQRSYAIVTDSGGIQEEAPVLNKPVLILRNKTERTEGIKSHTAKLVGISYDSVYSGVKEILTDHSLYQQMASAKNPYGDGQASKRVCQELKKFHRE